MSRLLKKSSIILNQFDENDIKNDKCPICKYEPLVKKDGYKYCMGCNSTYKLFAGNAHLLNPQEKYNPKKGVDKSWPPR
jgi:hypothetical protein